MEYHELKEMMEVFGYSPNMFSPPQGFIKYPPGLRNTTSAIGKVSEMRKRFVRQSDSVSSKLQDFHDMYRKYASGLLEGSSPIIPPTHPMYSRNDSISILKTEVEKLRKENLELKKQMGNSVKKEHHNP